MIIIYNNYSEIQQHIQMSMLSFTYNMTFPLSQILQKEISIVKVDCLLII